MWKLTLRPYTKLGIEYMLDWHKAGGINFDKLIQEMLQYQNSKLFSIWHIKKLHIFWSKSFGWRNTIWGDNETRLIIIWLKIFGTSFKLRKIDIYLEKI